jgi:hypothetical protein
MGAFRAIGASADDAPVKVLAWGPRGSGKTYLGLSAPDPAVINFEGRALEHHRRADGSPFVGQVVTPKSIDEGVAALREIHAGRVKCKTVVPDSLSIPYQYHVRDLTTKKNNGWNTDYVAVNKRMLEITEPLTSLPDVNVVAIARQVVRREGKDLVARGVKMLGDEERWPYDYDFVLHYAGRGQIEVEKSTSPHLPVGSIIRGDLDWARFRRLIAGTEALDGKRPAPAASPKVAPQQEPGPAGDVLEQDLGRPTPAARPAPADSQDPLGKLTDGQRGVILKRAAEHGIDVKTDEGMVLLRGMVRTSMPHGEVQLDEAHIPALMAKLMEKAA